MNSYLIFIYKKKRKIHYILFDVATLELGNGSSGAPEHVVKRSLSLSLSLSLAADNGINKDGWKRGSVGGVGGAGGAGGGGTRAAVDHPLCLFLAF